MRRRVVAIVILAGAVAAWGYSRGPRNAARVASLEGEIASFLMTGNPGPVNVSPSGDKLLLKSRFADDFELTVVDRATGRVLARDRSRDSQMAPAWQKSADDVIGFFADHAGDQKFQLFLWNVSTGVKRALPVPTTSSAVLRWAPSGPRFGYVIATSWHAPRRLVVVDTSQPAPSPIELLPNVSKLSNFAWSPRGDRVAAVRADDEGALAIAGAGGGPIERIELSRGGEVRTVAWAPDRDRLLATVRSPTAPYFELFSVELGDRSVRRLVSADGDVSGPLFSPDGRRIFYHVNRDGEVRLFTCAGDGSGARALGRGARALGPATGTTVVAGFSAAGDVTYVIHTPRGAAPGLFELDDAGTLRPLIDRPPSSAAEPHGTEAARVDIPSRDGTLIPAYVWRAPHVAGEPAAIVRIHGGPDAQSMRTWDGFNELAQRYGHHVIAINYRGSTGYGARFEQMSGSDERVDDVLAARDWAIRELGVRADRVLLMGHSYGAALAAQAAARDDRIGGIVLHSFTPLAPSAPARRHPPPRLLVVHGANDASVSPDDAEKSLAAYFGVEPSRRPYRFEVFPDEGHNFYRAASWARLYAQVLTLLDEDPR